MSFTQPLRHDANAGQVVLITGGGTGIGKATARQFAQTGGRVVICGRREEPLRVVEKELSDSGAECLAIPTDVRDEEQVRLLVERAIQQFGRIDVLVNNAGGQFLARAEDINAKGWRAVQRLAVDAAWNLSRTVAQESMIPGGGGLIVFIGFSPRRGIPGVLHGSTARGALEALASGLSMEWSQYGVRSVCLAAGTIETDALKSYGKARLQEARQRVPIGRLGHPAEVGATIAFLASSGGGYINGSTILVDGGVDAWGMGMAPPSRVEGVEGD